MGGGKSKAPSTPDYAKTAKTQAAEERKTAEEVTRWNRPTQINDMGRIDWTQDAQGNWTQKVTTDPALKAQRERLLALQGQQYGDLMNQGEFTGPDQVEWDPNSGNAAADAFFQSGMARLQPQQQQDATRMQTQLRQQGFQPGTEAYDRAYKNLLTSQGDVNSKMALDAKVLGGNEARANYASALAGQQQNYGQDMQKYQMPWDRAGTAQNLMNSLYTPVFQGFSGATGYNPADLMGAQQASFQSGMDKTNASNAKKGNTMNTAATVGTTAAMMMSDATLKHDITPLVGRDALATLLQLGGYTWKWNETGEEDMGVIAQEVQRVLPELVNTDLAKLRVNYTGLVALSIEAIKYIVEKAK